MKNQASIDPALIRPAGVWTHVDVAADGQRFHVALLGPGDAQGHNGESARAGKATDSIVSDPDKLVVLLHDFPQYWWAWRHVMPYLARAGYRVAAMDLRGFGGSDKPPSDYRLSTLARDVIGVAQGLGATQTVIVGHGIGGSVAWTCPATSPGLVKGIATVASPHPLGGRMLRARRITRANLQYALLQVPIWPERALLHGKEVRRLLRSWSAGGRCRERVLSQAERYAEVLRRPLAASAALEQIRGTRHISAIDRAVLRAPVRVPVLSIQGAVDPIRPAPFFALDGRYVAHTLSQRALPLVSHFPPEEDPKGVVQALLPFLEQCFK